MSRENRLDFGRTGDTFEVVVVFEGFEDLSFFENSDSEVNVTSVIIDRKIKNKGMRMIKKKIKVLMKDVEEMKSSGKTMKAIHEKRRRKGRHNFQ